jgi:hypothetical protein
MTTISLRTLLRDPRKVKRLTRAGEAVQVTDNGEPLWILKPTAPAATEEAERRRTVEKVFAEVRRERPSRISAARLLEESRR